MPFKYVPEAPTVEDILSGKKQVSNRTLLEILNKVVAGLDIDTGVTKNDYTKETIEDVLATK